MPVPLIAAIVGGAVAGTGVVSAASRKIYKHINGEIIYLTGLPTTGKTTFRIFLETGNLPSSKTEPTYERKEYRINIPEFFNIKICSDGESFENEVATDKDDDAIIFRNGNELDEAERIKDAFVILYFFNVKKFAEKRDLIETHMKFYASKLDPSGLFGKVKNFVDKNKIFIAVGTYTDECEPPSQQEMRKYMNCLDKACERNGFVHGSFKNAKSSDKLRKDIIAKIADLYIK